MSQLGQTVKTLREGLGFTQPQLAKRVGVTSQAVSQVELGKTAIAKSKFKVFAKPLKVKPDVLVDAWLSDVRLKVLKLNGVRVGKKK